MPGAAIWRVTVLWRGWLAAAGLGLAWATLFNWWRGLGQHLLIWRPYPQGAEIKRFWGQGLPYALLLCSGGLAGISWPGPLHSTGGADWGKIF